jgi:hypothetical protein
MTARHLRCSLSQGWAPGLTSRSNDQFWQLATLKTKCPKQAFQKGATLERAFH